MSAPGQLRATLDRGVARRRSGQSQEDGSAHLFECLRVHQDPTNFDNLGRVLGNVDAMFIAGRGHMNDHVAVEGGRGRRECGHVGGSVPGRDLVAKRCRCRDVSIGIFEGTRLPRPSLEGS